MGIASQKPHLVSRLVIDGSAQRLKTFFDASVELMQVLARACGHRSRDTRCGFWDAMPTGQLFV
ncbi:MAG: hypothetical protein AAFY85_05920 [Pseudomonadota bacterium]